MAAYFEPGPAMANLPMTQPTPAEAPLARLPAIYLVAMTTVVTLALLTTLLVVVFVKVL